MMLLSTPSLKPAVDILLAVVARGVELQLDGDRHILVRPISALTAAERRALRQQAAVAPALAQELARRVTVMRSQVPPAPAPIPALVARPDLPPRPGYCVSCGGPLTPEAGSVRCALCGLAAWMAITSDDAKVLA